MSNDSKLKAQAIIIAWKKQNGSLVRLRDLIAAALDKKEA